MRVFRVYPKFNRGRRTLYKNGITLYAHNFKLLQKCNHILADCQCFIINNVLTLMAQDRYFWENECAHMTCLIIAFNVVSERKLEALSKKIAQAQNRFPKFQLKIKKFVNELKLNTRFSLGYLINCIQFVSYFSNKAIYYVLKYLLSLVDMCRKNYLKRNKYHLIP